MSFLDVPGGTRRQSHSTIQSTKRALINRYKRLGEGHERRMCNRAGTMDPPEIDETSTSLLLVTPTYVGDRDNFGRLRSTLRETGCQLAHLAIVHTEDLPHFEHLTLKDPSLTLLPTSAVLPAWLEERRRRFARGRRAFTPRDFLQVDGWRAQQATKLGLARVIDAGAYVCIDSDSLAVGTLTASDFLASPGVPWCFSISTCAPELATWAERAARLFGEELPTNTLPLHTSPVQCIRTKTARSLLELLDSRDKSGLGWASEFLRLRLTEYELYAAYLRAHHPAYYLPRDADFLLSHQPPPWSEQRTPEEILDQVANSPTIRIVNVSSKLDPLEPWNELRRVLAAGPPRT